MTVFYFHITTLLNKQFHLRYFMFRVICLNCIVSVMIDLHNIMWKFCVNFALQKFDTRQTDTIKVCLVNWPYFGYIKRIYVCVRFPKWKRTLRLRNRKPDDGRFRPVVETVMAHDLVSLPMSGFCHGDIGLTVDYFELVLVYCPPCPEYNLNKSEVETLHLDPLTHLLNTRLHKEVDSLKECSHSTRFHSLSHVCAINRCLLNLMFLLICLLLFIYVCKRYVFESNFRE